MEKSSFFNARLQNESYDRVYTAEDFANYFSSFIGNGIFANPSNNLQVISNEDLPTKEGMPIILRSGKAFINGYFYENTNDLTLYVGNADGVLDRIDRVVLRLDFLNREIKSYILKGELSSNPTPPDISRNSDCYEIALADIKVKSGISYITNSSITDRRQNSSLCGIVKGTVGEINTTDLFNQFTTTFNELKEEEKLQFENWFNNLKNQLDNNQATNLQNQITTLKTDYDYFRTNGGEIGGNLSIVKNGVTSELGHNNFTTISSYWSINDETLETPIGVNLAVEKGEWSAIVPFTNKELNLGLGEYQFKNVFANKFISEDKEGHYTEIEGRSIRAYGEALALQGEGTERLYYYHDNFTNKDILFNATNKRLEIGRETEPINNIYLSGIQKAPNGYTKLPNGFILQWGTVTTVNMNNSNRNCQKTINYPYTFPNYVCCAMAQCVANNTDGGSANYISDINANMHSNSTSQAVVDIEILGSLDSYTLAFDITWFAIGY